MVTKTVTERCGMNLTERLSVEVGVVEGKVNGYEGAVWEICRELLLCTWAKVEFPLWTLQFHRLGMFGMTGKETECGDDSNAAPVCLSF